MQDIDYKTLPIIQWHPYFFVVQAVNAVIRSLGISCIATWTRILWCIDTISLLDNIGDHSHALSCRSCTLHPQRLFSMTVVVLTRSDESNSCRTSQSFAPDFVSRLGRLALLSEFRLARHPLPSAYPGGSAFSIISDYLDLEAFRGRGFKFAPDDHPV